MLVAAAICPHPPLLIPEVGGPASEQVAPLRAAAVEAVRTLLATRPDRLVVVGDADGTGAAVALVRADFRPFGVDLVVGHEHAIRLPLSLGVGRWLLREAGWQAPDEPAPQRGNAPRVGTLPDATPRTLQRTAGHGTAGQRTAGQWTASVPARWQGVARDLGPDEAARLGATCAGIAPRVAMLVMGDGTARRTPQAPGAFDPGAEKLDDEIATALHGADLAAIRSLDAARCDGQLVAGRASWQVLAGAATHSGGSWDGELLANEAPFGVGYFLASWRRR